MSLLANAIDVLDVWYKSLVLFQDKLPAKGTIAAALHVLDRLQAEYDLRISSHVAAGEAQITGLSSPALCKLLARFGETRCYRLWAVGQTEVAAERFHYCSHRWSRFASKRCLTKCGERF